MTARDFAKIGIIRNPELDFSDDGARFKGYTYGPLKLTYTTFDGMMYLSVRLDYEEDLGYHDYGKADWAEGYDDFNGVCMSTANLGELKAMLDRVAAGLNNYRIAHLNDVINVTAVDVQYMTECQQIRDFLDEVAHEFDWVHASKSDLNSMKYYVDSLQDTLRNMPRPIAETRNVVKREMLYRLNNYGYYYFNLSQDYRVSGIRQILAK